MTSDRRVYVSRLKRDGTAKPRGRPKHDPDRLSACFLNGVVAAAKGTPRYANPYQDMRARMWTRGWNTRHVEGRTSRCRGCKLCLVGTARASDADRETYERLTRTP
jgi:hypothetical protein